MSRGVAIFLAFCACWIIYMTMYVLGGDLGDPPVFAFFFQIIVAFIISGAFLAFALITGLIFKIPAVRKCWTEYPCIATQIIILSLGQIILCFTHGTRVHFVDPDTGENIAALSPLTGC